MHSQENVEKIEPFGVYFDKICLTYLQRTFILLYVNEINVYPLFTLRRVALSPPGYLKVKKFIRGNFRREMYTSANWHKNIRLRRPCLSIAFLSKNTCLCVIIRSV